MVSADTLPPTGAVLNNNNNKENNNSKDRAPYPKKSVSPYASPKPGEQEAYNRYPKVGVSSAEDAGDEMGGEEGSTAKKFMQLQQVACDDVGRAYRPMEDEPYYHGFLSRKESEDLLNKNGHFLVRKTEVSNQATFVISIFMQQVHHFIIKRTNKKRLYWVYRFAFKTVADLIQYHYYNREPIGSAGFILVTPVFKQEWQLNHEQVTIVGNTLGSGNFGAVFPGTLQISQFRKVDVAVKTLTITTSMTGDERIKFLREANLMLKLKNENVIKLYGVCAAKEPIMIVMEKAAAGLQSVMRNTTSPPTMIEKLNYIYGGCKGMEYIANQLLMHRDIALRNFLVGYDKEVKVADFGLSMLGKDYKERRMKNVPLRWLAPETLKRGIYTTKTDVYSFGIFIWEVYTNGVLEPYQETSNRFIKKYVVEKKITLAIPKEIDPAMEELRLKCMSYDPVGRPTFAELREEIEQIEGIIIKKPQTIFTRTLKGCQWVCNCCLEYTRKK